MNDDEILITLLGLALLCTDRPTVLVNTIPHVFPLHLPPASSELFAPTSRLASSLSTATSLITRPCESAWAPCPNTAGGRIPVLIGASLGECKERRVR